MLRHRLLCAALGAFVLSGCGAEERTPEPAPTRRSSASVDPDQPHEHEDPIDRAHVLVAGPAGTLSHRIAHGLQAAAQASGEQVAIAPSPSDLDALYLVGWGIADAGVVPGNVLAASIHRVGLEAVEAVAGLAVTEEVHVVVLDASPVKAVSDLQGKTVSVGRLGSGADLAARALLLASGLDPDAGDVGLRHEPPAEGLAALFAGQVDAVVLLGHVPEVRGAAPTRLVPIPPEDARAVAAREGGYVVVPGADEGRDVLAVHPWLVARRGLGERIRPLVDGRVRRATDLPEPVTSDGPPMAFRAEGAALVLAAGPAGGTYARVADGLVRVAELADVGAVRPAPTEGSFESFVLLATGQADLAIVQEDVVEDALRTPAVAPLVARTRLLTPLFREEVHLLASPDGGPRDLADLKGKTIAMGEPGSGTLFTARRLLVLAGMQRGDASGRAIGGRRALDALRAGRVQAAFMVGGQPMPLVAEAAMPLAPIRSAEGYAEALLTSGSYPWVGAPVPTVATRALLLVRRDLDPAQAAALVKALYANRKNLAAGHPKWAELDPASLAEPRVGLRLHPGVESAQGDLAPDSAPAW